MNRLKSVYYSKDFPSYLTPLFWQHGEDESTLREEIRQMHENGIGGFVVEARPHNNFLGDKWWCDIDIIIDEAKKRNMKIWFFDDCHFPSGFSAGKIRENHPEYLKKYLDERHIDAVGPLKGSSFIIKAWFNSDEEALVNVVAAKRIDGVDKIDGESLIDLTALITDGIMYWDVPEGNWRIFIFISTRNGGEEGTKDYLNPIEPEPVRAFIDYIYEEFYKHYAYEFGKTIKGFFSDEPRLGNAETYDGRLGNFNMAAPFSNNGSVHKMVLPFSDRLLKQLNQAWEGDFKQYFPCLWYNAGSITGNVRYVFMDVISKLFGECYTQQIGDWCREHGVKYIGHVVEDNGAHARLGFGPGHFFRAINGQDYSGLDLVYQVWPEYTSGKFSTPLGDLDAEFFYWGIAKMASSAGHIDPKKGGTTTCEIFGAYGWQEGLKLMKWLTDYVCVRGVNWLIPHAFSPKYPDPDCPPHFYASGANPQWRYFNIWSGYANRVCHLLTGGRHIAPVAVIYHAEAEWAGEYMPFEKVVKVLALVQIDCDIIPMDTIIDNDAVRLENGRFIINKEEYKAVIIPYSQRLPEEFVDKLLELAKSDIPVMFIDGYPEDSSKKAVNFIDTIKKVKDNKYSQVISLGTLTKKLENLGLYDIKVAPVEENLRYYHYENESENIFFFTNESKYSSVKTTVRIKTEDSPLAYDALEDQLYRVDYTSESGYTLINLYLEPYQSLFIIFGEENFIQDNKLREKINIRNLSNQLELKANWKVSATEAEQYPYFEEIKNINEIGNVAIPSLLPLFSGTLRYETELNYEKGDLDNKIFLDLGEVYEIAEVWINGIHAGIRICPPYYLDITNLVVIGQNNICIDVTNTLAKKHGNNILDRAMPQEPSGLIGPVRILSSVI